MERLDAFVFDYRNALAGAPLGFALLSTRWEWENHWAIWPLAVGLCFAGALMRAWAGAHCGYGQRRAKSLATTGPYAHVRNPLYVGNLLILLGATVASELAWLIPAVAVWAVLVYERTIRHEERRLLARYGDEFLRYRERVPTWLPRFRDAGGLWLRVVQREGLCLILLLPFLLKELDPFGWWPN